VVALKSNTALGRPGALKLIMPSFMFMIGTAPFAWRGGSIGRHPDAVGESCDGAHVQSHPPASFSPAITRQWAEPYETLTIGLSHYRFDPAAAVPV
jgi:hypothetical protein